MLRRFLLRPNYAWSRIRFASSVKMPALKEKPQPPPGIFGLYLRDNSEEFRTRNVYLNQNELVRLIGEQWKELPQDEKDIYRERYSKSVEQYKQQLIALEDEMNDDQRIIQALKEAYNETAKEISSKPPIDFPKRPTTAFAHFLKAAKKSFPKSSTQSIGEWNETMAGKWRDMNEEEKSKFREASKQSYMKFALEKDSKETFSLDEVGGFQR